MDRLDASQPITVTLDGSTTFLGRKPCLVFFEDASCGAISLAISLNLSKARKRRLTNFLNALKTGTTKIIRSSHGSVIPLSLPLTSNLVFFSSAKSVWDFLAARYTTAGLAHQYQLLSSLHRTRQEFGQSINDFLSQMYAFWDQLTPSEPTWRCTFDAEQFATYRDQQRLIHFLMALNHHFELIRVSLLHRNPLPTLEQAISELLSEETHLGLLKPSSTDTALAAFRPPPHKSSSSTQKVCKYYHLSGHVLLTCPTRVCRFCQKQGPGHYQDDCHKNPNCIYAGFIIAITPTNEAVLVTTPNITSLRDTDRVTGLLKCDGIRDIKMIVNRVRMDMIKGEDVLMQ
ncbi:hypothetical protein F0562_011338 [Nyssa sinensis]|uniref:Retrotransposon gag domain-containing protein n=1 Tax=Nyssa sinensis TaxID=561372 RepID=A0A5J5A4E6_9ASTE|nr:hypothetical protein F0562_011338 [Nyssa sinensis]